MKTQPIPEGSLAWMPKTAWGPMKWKELHLRALAYINLTRKDDGLVVTSAETKWFNAFVESIPCPLCQHHFQSYLQQNPLPEEMTRPQYFRWTVDAHNYVNRSLRKPELTIPEALALYADQWMEAAEMK